MKTPEKILIVQPQGIGDVIMMTPAITALKKHYQGIKIGMLVSSEAAANVLRGSPYCDAFFVMKRKESNILEKVRFLKKIRDEFSPDISIVAPHVSPKFGEPVSYIIGSKIRIGSHSVWPFFGYTHVLPESLQMHKSDAVKSYLKLIFHYYEGGGHLYFHIDKEAEELASKMYEELSLTGRIVLSVHPGTHSGGKIRRYPAEYFKEIILLFLNEICDSKCAVFLGTHELDLEMHFQKIEGVELVKGIPLRVVAAMIKKSRIFIGCDSGLSHVAAAVGIPTITIFGPGNPETTRPYSANNVVVRHEPILDCIPCINRKEYYSCNTRECLLNLLSERVFEVLKKRLPEIYR